MKNNKISKFSDDEKLQRRKHMDFEYNIQIKIKF